MDNISDDDIWGVLGGVVKGGYYLVTIKKRVQEIIDDIFEPFVTGAQGEDIGQKKGHGLGLYIAKEIIEAHHGFIKAYNQQGACFEIVLPQMKMKKKI